MGCDIHSVCQVFKDGKWSDVTDEIFQYYNNEKCSEPFVFRNYGVFGFLANVINYSFVPYLDNPRGLPKDITLGGEYEDYKYGEHSFSWLSLEELLAFDYDKTFEDRRCMRDGNGAADSGPGNGKIVTYREFLGKNFFLDLEVMKSLGDPKNVRIVFGFDS
jgi:hypothetical protein